MEGNLPNNNNTIALDNSIKELECINSEQGQIMLQTIHHILKKINQEHVLYRTLEVLGTYLSHPMVQRLADIEQCQTQAENILAQLGLMGSSTLESFLRMAEPARLWAEIVPTTNCSLTPASNNLALIFSLSRPNCAKIFSA
jgi:hypothetical protein